MTQQIKRFTAGVTTESAHMIAIAAGAGDVQGSSMALNLAICLAQMDKRVCVFEAVHGSSKQPLFNTPDSVPGWHDVIGGFISVEKLIQYGPEGIHLIPTGMDVADYSQLDTNQRQNLLLAFTQLQYDYDYLLIDRAAGFNDATTSFLVGAGSIVLTITPEAETLADAFSLLKGINQRVFQQPVKVIVNIVAGAVEAKQIIAKLGIAVRKYLGIQCGSLSFYIMDQRMLSVISDARLVMLDYPDSVPAQCLKGIADRLAHTGPGEALTPAQQPLTESQGPSPDSARPQFVRADGHWLSEAIHAIESAPIEVMQPIMQKLNKIWQQRTQQLSNTLPPPNSVELEILKLKTAIHFASHARDKKSEEQ